MVVNCIKVTKMQKECTCCRCRCKAFVQSNSGVVVAVWSVTMMVGCVRGCVCWSKSRMGVEVTVSTEDDDDEDEDVED